MVKIILNSFLFWGGWIIIPFIMEIVHAVRKCFSSYKKESET